MTREGRNPYVGPRPFGPDDADYFFGRDDETRELVSLILAHPATILFSESGAGKTSLLNAKVIPALKKKECEVIGPVRVSAEFSDEFAPPADINVYVLSALLFIEPHTGIAQLSASTLSEYLKNRPKPKTPYAIRPPRVIIFDQFEELFTTRADRWQDRARFLADIADALNDDPRLRVVFAMREEFLATIDSCAMELPDGIPSRVRLERLRKHAALSAVEKPLAGTGVTFAPGVAERLVDNLLRVPAEGNCVASLGEFVEPVHLQLVCHRIWNALPATATIIGDDAIDTYGDVDSALRSYFDECIAAVAEETKLPEGQLRAWFQRSFITPERTRGLVFRTAKETGGLPNKVVDALQKRYLVRAETRERSRWYELAHERLIAPVVESNARWRCEHEAGTIAIESMETRADGWRRANRSDDLLLNGRELVDAIASRNETRGSFGMSDTLNEFISASEAAGWRRRSRRVRRQLFAGLTIVVLLTIGSTGALMLGSLDGRRREQSDFAKTLLNTNGGALDALSWALRARAQKLLGRSDTKLVRRALQAVGPTVWLRRTDAPILNAFFSPKGDRVLTLADKEICVWDAVAGTPLSCEQSPPRRIWREAFFSRSGTYVLARSEAEAAERKKTPFGAQKMADKVFEIWNWSKDSHLQRLDSLKEHRDISVSPDDLRFAVAHETPDAGGLRRSTLISVFEVNDGKLVKSFAATPAITFISLSSNGTRLMTADEDYVRVWDVATGIELGHLQQMLLFDRNVKIKWYDNDEFFIGYAEPVLFSPLLVHIRNGKIQQVPLRIPRRVIETTNFSEDGRIVVTTADEKGLRAYEVNSHGEVLDTMEHSPDTYVSYANYLAKKRTATLERNTKELCSYSTSDAPTPIPLNGFRTDEFTSLSPGTNRLLTVAHGVARVWNADEAKRRLDGLSDDAIVDTSCSRLRNQPALLGPLLKQGVCGVAPFVSPATSKQIARLVNR